MQFFENKNNIDDLIVGFLKNELSSDQIMELTAWLQQSKENKRYFDESREIWITAKALNEEPGFNAEKGFESFLNSIEEEKIIWLSKEKWLKIARVAAIFIIAFLLGGFVFTKFGKEKSFFAEDKYSEVVVPRGAKASFTLLDGTQVTLNAGSKLRYNSNYGNKDRIVDLEGEGYFKVAKDKTRPFIVNTSHMSVKALGTEFNVKAYPADKTIETTLVEGSVKIERLDEANSHEEVILKPNQKLTFYTSGSYPQPMENIAEKEESRQKVPEKLASVQKLVKENVKVEPLISWKEDRWIIEKENLSKLAVELERKFNIQILFKTERLKDFRFTGTLLDEPLEQVLKVMCISAPINYEINGKKVTLTERENFESIYRKLYHDKK